MAENAILKNNRNLLFFFFTKIVYSKIEFSLIRLVYDPSLACICIPCHNEHTIKVESSFYLSAWFTTREVISIAECMP